MTSPGATENIREGPACTARRAVPSATIKNVNAARIAIPVPTSADAEYNTRSWPNYAAAVEQAGGSAVRLELTLDGPERDQLLATCDGILLPGSPADVDPLRFTTERDQATAPADVSRETIDFSLLDHAQSFRKPVLGICYGCQSMNVWRGGSLVQDLCPLPVNHSAGRQVAVAHSALVSRHSLLGEMVGQEASAVASGEAPGEFLRLPINSSHHQAIASPGEGLRVVARCPEDGVIEAIEAGDDAAGGFLLGVQWHPERSIDISAASRALFSGLVRAAEQARQRRQDAEAATPVL